jgi:hypothetical protein
MNIREYIRKVISENNTPANIDSSCTPLYVWCKQNGLTDLTGDAIHHFFYGGNKEDNPFNKGFYTMGYSRIRDGELGVYSMWSEALFGLETEIASSLKKGSDGYVCVSDLEKMGNLINSFKDLEDKSQKMFYPEF